MPVDDGVAVKLRDCEAVSVGDTLGEPLIVMVPVLVGETV